MKINAGLENKLVGGECVEGEFNGQCSNQRVLVIF